MRKTNHIKKIIVLGAGGQIAQWVIRMLRDAKGVKLTLFLRNARKLHGHAPANARVVEGDVLDKKRLASAMDRRGYRCSGKAHCRRDERSGSGPTDLRDLAGDLR